MTGAVHLVVIRVCFDEHQVRNTAGLGNHESVRGEPPKCTKAKHLRMLSLPDLHTAHIRLRDSTLDDWKCQPDNPYLFASSVCRRINSIYHFRHAIRKFGLNCQILGTLPSMKSIIYSPNLMKDREHVALVDFDCARRAGITLHGSVSAMSRQKSGNPLRFMAIAWTAWLNKSSQELEWASIAQDVGNPTTGPLHYRRKFTIGSSFKDHFKERHFQNQLVDSLCTSGCLQTKSE